MRLVNAAAIPQQRRDAGVITPFVLQDEPVDEGRT
jgi:hypothetical protein